MKGQMRNVIVGIFVFAAILLLVYLVLFLHPTVGDADKTLRVRFTNIEKVTPGTRVTLAGKPVGQVVAINEIRDARDQPQPDDETRRLYFFELTLAVDSSVQVYDTDQVVLKTMGLFGEKIIEIEPMKPPAGVTPILITNQVIYAQAGDQMQQLFDKIIIVAEKMGDALDSVNELMIPDEGPLCTALDSLCQLSKEIQITVEDINDNELITSVKEAADSFSEAMDAVETTLTYLIDEEFWNDIDRAFSNIGDAAENFTKEEGTLGRFLNDPTLYDETAEAMAKANTFLNDVNHYGILYQFNRGWQRRRTDRANALQKAKTPAAFRQYFNTEVDQIQTALSRIQMMLERATCECNKQGLFNNPCFTEELDQLQEQLQTLEERLERTTERLSAWSCPSPQGTCPTGSCPR